ncbi:SAM-dependent methyltransferase [Kitasatospora sp. NPDC002543]
MANEIRTKHGPYEDPRAVDLRTDVPHAARVYDYLIGGTTNFEADRIAAHASVRAWPSLPVSMRTTREFMRRSVRRLAEQYGVRQFLPESIIGNPRLREVLDLARPVALSLIAMVHFVPDEQDPQGIVRRLMDALAPGSFLALTVFTGDTDPVGVGGVGREYNARGIPLQIRDRAETEAFFTGYELLDPGVALVHRWWPEAGVAPVRDRDIAMYAGVAVKR